MMRCAALLATVLLAGALSGCTVIAVAGTAVGIAASGVGLVLDAAVGTAKIAGKAIGATADAVIP